MPSRLEEILAQLDADRQGSPGGGGLGTARVSQEESQPGGFQRLLGRLLNPLVDVPELPGGIIGEGIERGIEELSSPVGLVSAALIPVTGGASLGLRGALGVGARLGTRALGEVAVGGAASVAAREVSSRLPENTPGVLKLGAALGAGVVAGAGVGKVIRTTVGREVIQTNATQMSKLLTDTSTTPEIGMLANMISKANRVDKDEIAKTLSRQRGHQLGQAERALSKSLEAGGAGREPIRAAQSAAAEAGKFKRVELKFDEVIPPELGETLVEQIAKATNVDMTKQFEAARALEDILGGSMPTTSELLSLEAIFGTGITRAVSLKSGNLNKAMAALNAPRALVASADLSAPFRQGIMLIGHPKEFFGNIKGMVNAFSDPKYFDKQLAWLRGNEDELINSFGFTPEQAARAALEHKRASTAGLALTGSMIQQEEMFIGAMVGPFKNSLAARTVGASERAYTMYLNKLRRDVFNKTADNLKHAGNLDTHKNLRDYAGFLNAATGRGPKAVLSGPLGKVLNAGFFAPGYFVSRFNAPTYLWRADGAVQKQVWRDMGIFAGSAAASLSLLGIASKAGYIPGLSVEHDPRSSDFGKIRIGNTRYDYLGGYQQIVRNLVQTATGQRKTSEGKFVEANRMETLMRFGQSKLSPSAGIGVDLLKGETFLGTEVDLKDPNFIADSLIAEHLLPLALQDIEDGFHEGSNKGAAMALPGLFGVGTQTFLTMGELKDDLAFEAFGVEDYDELTGAQRQIVEQHPRMIEKGRELDNKSDTGFREQSTAIEEEKLVSQQAFFARLSTGTMRRDDFADGMGDTQVRASTKRDQAATDFGLDGFTPGSPLATVLHEWYGLFSAADFGAERGVETGKIDWELFDQLEHDYLAKLNPAEKAFIEERSRRDNAPEVEWFYNDKEYIRDAGYHDVVDASFDRFKTSVHRLFPDVESLSDLQNIELQAVLDGDTRRQRLAHNLIGKINRDSGKRKERLRRQDPKLDAALWHTGRTNVTLTRAAAALIPNFGVDR